MFTEEDSKRQDAAFKALKAEFEELQEQEKKMRAALAPVENLISDTNLSPEVSREAEKMKKEAERAGRERAARFEAESSQSPSHGAVHGASRRNVVRI